MSKAITLKKDKYQLVRYRGFIIKTGPIYETTESRLARGDWQSLVIGYGATVTYQDHPLYPKRQGKLAFVVDSEDKPMLTPELLLENIRNLIDLGYKRLNKN